MRGLIFDRAGPQIPFELVTAQEQGDVVFLCGAGVSMPELPGFIKLVADVYTELGESWLAHPAEAEGMNCPDEFKAPDRTLNALAERMGDGGAEIRKKVTKALSTNTTKSPFHNDLMRLSRGVRDCRLITTNFDTLFERSWREFQQGEIASYCTAGMPGPGSTRWTGIFHLHGRIADPQTNDLPESDLVLTSAEFGDAYLRSGWASRYLYDLLRHSHVVIVGYSLSDPPTRYLFDALAADRKRFVFKNLYALVSADDDEEKIAKLWQGRGAIPLTYKAPPISGKSGRDHSGLRRSISEWAIYADNPTGWAKSKLQKIFRRAAKQLPDAEWNALDWILSRADNHRLLQEANPTSRWLSVLRERNDKRHRDLEFGPWIAQRLDDRPMIDAVLRNKSVLDKRARSTIEFEVLRPNNLSTTRRTFWLALCGSIRDAEKIATEAHYLLARLLKSGDANGFVRGLIAETFTPIAAFGPAYSSGSPRAGRNIAQIARISFEMADRYVEAKEVLKSWPQSDDGALLEDLVSALKDHLRKRHALVERPISSVWIVPSISDHPQNRHGDDLSQLIRLIVGLMERLSTTNPESASHVSKSWQNSSDQWEVRLWLHALSIAGLHPAHLASSYLISAPDEVFWGATYQREIMRLLISRWAEFSAKDTAEIENRLIQGNER